MRIDWPAVDPLIRKHLPQMSRTEFCEKYAPFTIPRTIGQRAKKLGVKPAKRVISEAQRAAISKSVKSRTAWRIDWSKYDDLIKSELPKMTVIDFRNTHCSGISDKQVAKRAKKLGVKSAAPKTSDDKRRKIAEGVRQYHFTDEQDQYMRDHANDMGQKEIARALSISHIAVWRRMDELELKRSDESLHEVRVQQGAISGHLGALANKRRIKNMTPDEYKVYCRRVRATAQKAFADGKIKPHHGIGQDMDTKKGGKFRTRSSYETKYVEMLEADPEVIRFEYEPFAIEYEYEDEMRSYTPDFFVSRINQDELVEVKPERMVTFGRNPAKIKAGREYCNDRDVVFKVVTESVLCN